MMAMRKFSTGATRDDNTDKFDYNGFNSSAVEHAFAAYMHKHRKQADGSMRGSDNWKAGIPKSAYLESLHRHFMDLWLVKEGNINLATETSVVDILCAIRFNVNGLLHEELKDRHEPNALVSGSAVAAVNIGSGSIGSCQLHPLRAADGHLGGTYDNRISTDHRDGPDGYSAADAWDNDIPF
jgi:hypothetical protein